MATAKRLRGISRGKAHICDQTTYRFTDILLAVWTPDSRLDDLVVGDPHVQMSDRVQSKADTQEVENCLNKHSA